MQDVACPMSYAEATSRIQLPAVFILHPASLHPAFVSSP
jgi:hypothetical protein